jgi:hypothetical protein
MKLYEWEIWHTYTSYLKIDQVDLVYTANCLVESGVAYLALHRDGYTVWRGKEGVGKGESVISLSPDGHRDSFRLKYYQEDAPELGEFAAEAWWQACRFRFNELRIFGTSVPMPHPYIRLFLGQFNLVRDEKNQWIRLYPVIMIFESGIVIIEFRTISPGHEISLNDFINSAVNLFREPFDRVDVPPGLSKLATRAWYHSGHMWKFHQRAALLFLERGHDLAVAQKTATEDDGNFKFDLSPLSRSDDPESFEQLSSLALSIFHTLAYVLGRPRKGWGFLFRGQRSIPEIGGFWSGRPHIHLIKFEDQRETALENEDAHGEAFGAIMLRVSGTTPTVARSYLPADSRIFQDYSSYISSALSLWVWSLSGLRQQERWADPNRGHLIYGHQATVELLEYGYMLHRSLLERANDYGHGDEILSARKNLLQFEQDISEASHYGEIRNLLERGWEAMGLKSICARIRESLEIRGSQASIEESRLNERIGRALSILFGLIAVPPISEKVLKPLWNVFQLPRPKSDDQFSLLCISLSLLVVALIVGIVLKDLNRNKKSEKE